MAASFSRRNRSYNGLNKSFNRGVRLLHGVKQQGRTAVVGAGDWDGGRRGRGRTAVTRTVAGGTRADSCDEDGSFVDEGGRRAGWHMEDHGAVGMNRWHDFFFYQRSNWGRCNRATIMKRILRLRYDRPNYSTGAPAQISAFSISLGCFPPFFSFPSKIS